MLTNDGLDDCQSAFELSLSGVTRQSFQEIEELIIIELHTTNGLKYL